MSTLADYRNAVRSGLSSIPLTATMQGELARQIAMRGPIDPSLTDAIASVPALQTISDAYALHEDLSTLYADISIAAAGTPRTVNANVATLKGAAAGFATGGPYGAIAGGIGGLLGARDTNTNIGKQTKNLTKAANAMSAGEVGRTLAGLAPGQRELALASGQGQDAAQALSAAVSRSGMRDSALGALAGITGAVLPEQIARANALTKGLAGTRRAVESILGSPVRAGKDRLTEALGIAAEGFATYKALFPSQPRTSSTGSSSSLPSGEGLFNTPPPTFQIPNASDYSTFA